MSARPELSFDEQVEAIRRGEVSKEQLQEHTAELKQQIEEQRQRDQEIDRFAEKRRKIVAEQQINSGLQHLVNNEP